MKFKIIAAVCAFACVSVFAAESPTQVVQKKDAELQSLIRKSVLSAKEKERIKGLLSDVFDFELLAQKIPPGCDMEVDGRCDPRQVRFGVPAHGPQFEREETGNVPHGQHPL